LGAVRYGGVRLGVVRSGKVWFSNNFTVGYGGAWLGRVGCGAAGYGVVFDGRVVIDPPALPLRVSLFLSIKYL